MLDRKFLTTVFSLVMIVSLLIGGTIQVAAQPFNSAASMPASPTDESKVPHYFGPYPNWANSPFRLPNVSITLDGGGGTG